MDFSPRTLIYGFHEASLASAIDSLHCDCRLKVVHWIGVNSATRTFDEDIHEWHLKGIAKPDFNATQEKFEGLCRQIRKEHFSQIVDQLSRNVVCRHVAPADYPILINHLVNRFAGLLRDTQVELLIFQNLPHEGFELVLYLVARSLGIATLMTYQSIIPNRFFYCTELDDFGWFRTANESDEEVMLELPMGFEKELFYMKGVSESLKRGERRNWRKTMKRHLLFAKIAFKVWKQRIGWYDRLGLAQPRIPEDQRYEWEVYRVAQRRVDFAKPFVYFPLHLQPELTTSAIGDKYSHQLDAIEELSRWIPKNWSLYVKENPKQTHRYRTPDFFARIRRMTNVVFVDRSIDTYQLLSKCRFTATITGTVGWEAISGGKSVIVFGRPWYLTLPGVERWPVDATPEQVAHKVIDHGKLSNETNRLLRKTARGIVDSAYQASMPDYSQERNTRLVADFLRRQLTMMFAVSPCS
jgi:hypothetical protein